MPPDAPRNRRSGSERRRRLGRAPPPRPPRAMPPSPMRRRGTALGDPVRQFQFSLLLLVAVMVVGTIGYHWIEGLGWLDSAYMTVITVATVGFGEVRPLTAAGRVFTMGLIVVGVGT